MFWIFEIENTEYFLMDAFGKEGFPGGSNSKLSAYNVGDPGSIPGSGRYPGEKNGNSSILAWRMLWTEKPDRLQSTGSQRVRHD